MKGHKDRMYTALCLPALHGYDDTAYLQRFVTLMGVMAAMQASSNDAIG